MLRISKKTKSRIEVRLLCKLQDENKSEQMKYRYDDELVKDTRRGILLKGFQIRSLRASLLIWIPNTLIKCEGVGGLALAHIQERTTTKHIISIFSYESTYRADECVGGGGRVKKQTK